MIKASDELGVDWLHTILNEFLTDERVPGDLKESEIVTIYKQKGDAFECGNYRGIKLLEIALKLYEWVIERRIRETVHIHSNQFGFMPERGTIDPIFILLQVQEKILEWTENDTGHVWIWKELLMECLERCYTGVYDVKELVRSLWELSGQCMMQQWQQCEADKERHQLLK